MTERPAGRLAPNAGRPSSLPVEFGAADGAAAAAAAAPRCGGCGGQAPRGAAAAEVAGRPRLRTWPRLPPGDARLGDSPSR